MQNHFCTVPFLGQCAKYAKLGDLRTDAIFESYRRSKLCKIGECFPIFAQPMCKIVFALFLHSRSPLFERNDQLLRKRISLDYIKSKLLPIRLQKLKYRSSCISAKHRYGPCPHFGHGRGAFEGFDFVGEAAHVGIGRAFGLFRLQPLAYTGAIAS